MRPDLPTGTVTFLFTDVEGSTKLLEEIGDEAYDAALAEHRQIVRGACTKQGGVEVDTQGDALFFAFPTAPGALAAASAMTHALAPGRIRVRIGLHTGRPRVSDEGYVGKEVHFAARVAATGHGGQIVLSRATAELVEADLTELGEHRLKDVRAAVPIYQLGSDSFPPLKTLSNTNLPRPASSFVGREAELEAVLERIEAGARLLTLTGPGGSGKTRLALEAAATLVPEYKAGVFWVGLAALRDSALVAETISQTLGAKDGLAEHIGEREMLLLLDNLEQVVEAAPELASLVEACPNLALLVTSRELLRVRGEVEFVVPPLQEPEAVFLFCERSQLEPSNEIAELCRRLDSLPLAVELAAARTKALSPKQILERLSQRLDLLKGGRDADPRQQTLRATIEWSYELLSEEEQRLSQALSVFAGGCTLEAAAEIADADLDTLQSLVEKSLLRFSNERYWMLETIREYAAERLEASGEDPELQGRHAAYYLACAAELEQDVAVTREWLDRVEAEHDNIRAALDMSKSAGDIQFALRLADAVWRFWKVRGHLVEAHRRFAALLAADLTPTVARGHALNAAAGMAVENGEYDTGARLAEEALGINRGLGDASGTARSVFMIGFVAIHSGDFETAQPNLEEAVRLFSELGEEHQVLIANCNLAWACDELGDENRARALLEETLRGSRATEDRQLEAFCLDSLGWRALEDGRIEEAFTMITDALRIRRDLGHVQHQLNSLQGLASAQAAAGHSEMATLLLSSSLAGHEQLGLDVMPHQVKSIEETLARIHSQLDDPTFAEAWERGAGFTLDEAVALALADLT